MMDLGANVYVSAQNLLQFALMGYAYFSIIDPKRNPKIGLINICLLYTSDAADE